MFLGTAPADGAALDPVAGDLDDEGDELEEVVDAVLATVDVAGDPVVDASATPAMLPPRPAAMTAVMTSRRTRPALLDAMGFSLLSGHAVA